ncbi:MAG: efflux RND transporter permease subunit, partial [Spirochaetales bacterium]|nr:efflux RND transporter permease subunit [Spirochaetales bacterium]
HIDLDMDSLAVRGVSFNEAAGALSSYLVSGSVGRIIEAGIGRSVRIESGIQRASEIEELQILPGIRTGELGRVREALSDGDNLFLYNGREAVCLEIYGRGQYGQIRTARAVRAILPELEKEFQGRLELNIIDDMGIRIEDNLKGLLLSLLRGLAAASLILALLYRRGLPVLIISLSIPYTLIVSLFFLYLLNISINAISLYGMIASLGLIADNSIVVLHELEEGHNPYAAAPALLSSTLTTAAVFLPPLFLPGPSGVVFRDLVYTVIVTVAVSLPTALFLTPACWYLIFFRIGAVPLLKKSSPSDTGMIRLFSKTHSLMMTGKTGPLLLFLSIIPTLLLSRVLPFRLFPPGVSESAGFTLTLPEAAGYLEIRQEVSELSTALQQTFDLSAISFKAGGPDGDPEESLNRLEIQIQKEIPVNYERSLDIAEFCRLWTGGSCSLLPVKGSFEELFPRDRGPMIEAFSREALKGLPSDNAIPGENYLLRVSRFDADRERMTAMGISPFQVQEEILAMTEGIEAGELISEGVSSKVRIRAEADGVRIQDLPVGPESVRAGQLGVFTEEPVEALLFRSGGMAVVSTAAPLNGVLPPGVQIREESHQQGPSMVFLYMICLVLLYLILGIQTGCPRKALLLLTPLIPALSWAMIFLWILGQELNLYSFTGLLILMGTIVNSGILLLDSLEKSDDLFKAVLSRAKPLFATSLSTAAALLPVMIRALREGSGEAGLAAALTGGLLGGTLMTLLILPSLYQNQER